MGVGRKGIPVSVMSFRTAASALPCAAPLPTMTRGFLADRRRAAALETATGEANGGSGRGYLGYTLVMVRIVIFNICEYECQCLFLIFVHANANSEKTCEYSDHH